MTRLGILAALALGLSACITYDPELAQEQAAGGDATTGGTACATPKTAQIRVQEYAFIIECGCLEAPGSDSKQCTVPVGTAVTWIFEGSVSHNVTSDDHDFASSPDHQRGSYVVTFDAPGSYPYECSLHAGLMSDYRVVVH